MVEGDRDRYGGKSEVELEQSSLMVINVRRSQCNSRRKNSVRSSRASALHGRFTDGASSPMLNNKYETEISSSQVVEQEERKLTTLRSGSASGNAPCGYTRAGKNESFGSSPGERAKAREFVPGERHGTSTGISTLNPRKFSSHDLVGVLEEQPKSTGEYLLLPGREGGLISCTSALGNCCYANGPRASPRTRDTEREDVLPGALSSSDIFAGRWSNEHLTIVDISMKV
ncbi:hypothetical protein HZH68_008397 [Vespula germanica]|uniref:Uncharacterized protein n=1 Tax=Vespula germanica TaxID=30212 RepID=A0A834K4N6_VESGE|nr:hypothetical protein HZH68_008397 [Vespula germanica]